MIRPASERSLSAADELGLRSRLAITAASFSAIGLIALAECRTMEEVSFGIFYLVPVAVVTWYVGQRTAWVTAVVAATAWFLADRATGHVYPHTLVPFWNGVMRLGYFVSIAFVLHRLRAALDREKRLSRQDPLTGLLNGRAFFGIAESEVERSGRYEHPLSFAFLDVDDFKRVNDRLGHAAGDDLLQSIAKAMRDVTRQSDALGRVGGDEFAILLPETGADSARAAVEKLRRTIGEVAGETLEGGSISIGLVTFLRPVASVREMTHAADTLMYAAKAEGKNALRHRVIASDEEAPTLREGGPHPRRDGEGQEPSTALGELSRLAQDVPARPCRIARA